MVGIVHLLVRIADSVQRSDISVFEHHIRRQFNVVVLDILNVGHLGDLSARGHILTRLRVELIPR